MAHSWIWRRSELDFGHWFIWELLQDGIDRGELVVDVGVVGVVVPAFDDPQSVLVKNLYNHGGYLPDQNGRCLRQK